MTERRQPESAVRDRLREAARTHAPDRERMLARVERGMADGTAHGRVPRRRRRWPSTSRWAVRVSPQVRVFGAVSALVAVVLCGVVGTAALLPDDPGETRVAAPRTPTPDAGDLPSPRPSAGFVWSDGSVDPHSMESWSQSNVTLKNGERLTALTVELRISQTGEVTDTGSWRTLPEKDFTLSVREVDGTLVYRWTLRKGRTVPAGEHVFAGQFNHAPGGRDAGGDSYRVRARSADQESVTVHGNFARTP